MKAQVPAAGGSMAIEDAAILSRCISEFGEPATAFARYTMVRIPRTTIDELIEQHPRITRALWWATLVDEAILRENIAGLGQREAHHQMAHLFCELRARLETVGLVDNNAFDLPFTQEELGGASPVPRHTFGRMNADGHHT